MRTRSLVTALLTPALLVAVAPAASAQKLESTAAASAPPGVLYNACVDHLASYAVTLDTPDRDWFLSLEVHRADGGYVAGNYKAKQFGDPTAGTIAMQMCGNGNDPGTYTLQGRLQYGLTNTSQVPPTTFTLRNPLTSTTAKTSDKHPRKGQTVTITITSRDEMPGGYTRKDDATVVLQHRTAKGWKKVRGSKTTTGDRGKAKVEVRYPGGKLKLRAVTKGSADWDGSHSRKVVLR